MIYIDDKPNISKLDFQNILYELKLSNKFSDSKVIVIKLNLTAGSYIERDSHAITCIESLKELIVCILESDPMKTVFIAESDSSNYDYAFLKFEHLRIPQILGLNSEELKRVHVLDLSRDKLTRIKNRNFRYFINKKQLWLSETLLNADFVISLSNLKTHSQAGFTGACKNLFGVLPESNKWTYHPWINDVIHDVVLAVSPELSIVDGFYAMEGNGPIEGTDIDVGFRVWSDCPVQSDAQACNMVGIKTGSIRYLHLLCTTLKLGYLLKSCKNIKRQIKNRKISLNIIMHIGLSIQSAGTYIQLLGHRIRSCSNIPQFIKVLLSIYVPGCVVKHINKYKVGDV